MGENTKDEILSRKHARGDENTQKEPNGRLKLKEGSSLQARQPLSELALQIPDGEGKSQHKAGGSAHEPVLNPQEEPTTDSFKTMLQALEESHSCARKLCCDSCSMQ
mmetsp:Transcript_7374/g.11797  ORF Transcript_7374/g.11797 Transcript_7374/m.11797 type:complete len:107 (+) Transcript_7374:843-1163(+)